MTRGYSNNNPLNIRHSNDIFQGEIKGSDAAFKTFQTMSYGYRAAFVTLATYNTRGWNTIEKIITHWAPPTENDTHRYIATVVKISGIEKDTELRLTDGICYILIIYAMSFVENGINADLLDIKTGLHLQNKITIP